MNSGFTTWPERQFEWEKLEGPSNSLNHPMHSGFAAYFYESLGGIKASKTYPGYKVFTVNPQFPSQLKSASVEVPTPYGTIKNTWNVDGKTMTVELEVPFNTTAEVILSAQQQSLLKINGMPLADFLQKHNLIQASDNLLLGSGAYVLTYKR